MVGLPTYLSRSIGTTSSDYVLVVIAGDMLWLPRTVFTYHQDYVLNCLLRSTAATLMICKVPLSPRRLSARMSRKP